MTALSCLIIVLATAAVNGFVSIRHQAFLPRGKRFNQETTTPPVLKMVVERVETTHTLYYVPSIEHIDYDPDAIGKPSNVSEVVSAWEMTNDMNVQVKAMARGANLVALNIGDTKFIWENIEGAVYYGRNTSNFPYQRGLSLNGGIRFAAVCAEHGLYYDSDWGISFSDQVTSDGMDSKSIIYTIVDNDANRKNASEVIPGLMTKIAKPSEDLLPGFSINAFSNETTTLETPSKNYTYGIPMSKYPTTDLVFTYNITLVDGEDFVRLRQTVKNPTDVNKNAEAWLPMTFPIDEGSLILSRQKERWRRDEWCFKDLPNIVPWEKYPLFDKCLDWPSGGIFYDIPKKDGRFHGVVTNSTAGTGVVYVAPDKENDLPHFTKMWSWGNKEAFLSEGSNALTQGRPASEYYEPWSSGTNFAFFQSAVFEAKSEVTWDVAILPITSGLKGKTKEQLLDDVDKEIDNRKGLVDLTGVKMTPIH